MSLLRDKFISFLQLKGFTKATVRNYIQSIKQLQDWLGKSPVHITRDSAHRYLDYLKNGKKLAPRTMNIHIYALKRFCDFFLPESDIMSPFSRMHTPKYQPHVISAAETQALINAAPNLKAKAIITTIYSAGLRISECLNLKFADIDSKRMVIHVFGKGQRERYALLSPICSNAENRFWSYRNSSVTSISPLLPCISRSAPPDAPRGEESFGPTSGGASTSFATSLPNRQTRQAARIEK